MHKLSLVAVASLGFAAACAEAPTGSPVTTPEVDSPAFSAGASGVIPGRFIVTLRDGVSPAAVARDHGVQPDCEPEAYAIPSCSTRATRASRSSPSRAASAIEPAKPLRTVVYT